jgi:hypothetical protein
MTKKERRLKIDDTTTVIFTSFGVVLERENYEGAIESVTLTHHGFARIAVADMKDFLNAFAYEYTKPIKFMKDTEGKK